MKKLSLDGSGFESARQQTGSNAAPLRQHYLVSNQWMPEHRRFAPRSGLHTSEINPEL